MRICLVILLALVISGCAVTEQSIKPSRIYKLEGGRIIKVYDTGSEKIYVTNGVEIIAR